MIEGKIAVTGGTGFIGSRLVARLEREGYKTSVLSLSGEERGVKSRIIKGDLVKNKGLKELLKGADLVINLVGGFLPPFEKQLETNVLALENLCQAVTRMGKMKIIHVSSAAVYGKKSNASEEDALLPDTTYGLAKKMGEEVLQYYQQSFGIPVIIFRPPNIYGFGTDHGVVYNFLESVKKGKVTVFGDGKQRRDFLYVDDLVEAIIKAIDFKADFEVFNVGTGKTYALLDVVSLLEKVLNKKIKIEFKEAESHVSRVVGVKVKKAKKKLNWQAKTSLAYGLTQTYEKR